MSVIIPTRNRAQLLLRTALRAALLQEGVSLEVIVVDDASTDGTAEQVTALGDPRVRVLRHETRHDQFRARNTGIAAARGEWLAFLDDDDLWAPEKLRTQLDRAASEGAAFAYSAGVVVDERGDVKAHVPAPPAEDLARQLLVRNWLRAGSSTVVARADVVASLGGFDETLAELADWDFWIRLALAGRGASCPEVLVAYVAHAGNRRIVDEADVEAELEYLARKHGDAHARLGVDFDRVVFSRWVAEGHRRAGRRRKASGVYLRTGLAERNAGNLLRAAATPLGRPVDLLYDRLYERLAVGGALPRPAWLSLYDGAAPAP